MMIVNLMNSPRLVKVSQVREPVRLGKLSRAGRRISLITVNAVLDMEEIEPFLADAGYLRQALTSSARQEVSIFSDEWPSAKGASPRNLRGRHLMFEAYLTELSIEHSRSGTRCLLTMQSVGTICTVNKEAIHGRSSHYHRLR